MNEHLYRSRDDRMISGVAGGLAEIWDADPSLIRIVWALLVVLTGGLGLLVYIIMAIVVPEGSADDAFTSAPAPGPAPAADPGPGTTPASATGATADPNAATAAFVAATPPVQASAGGSPTATSAADRRRAARAARRAALGERGSPVGLVFGALLIIVGVAFLLREWWPAFDFDFIWPLALVALGVVVLVVGLGRDRGKGGTST
jgi:phage shock protein C